MADKKLAFGEKSKRLVAIWTTLGKDAGYKEASAEYKRQFPKEEQPSDQTVGNARKKAFGLTTTPRKAKTQEANADHVIGVINVLRKYGKLAEDVVKNVQETPVNPFQEYDDAAGGRENLLTILGKLVVAQTASDLA